MNSIPHLVGMIHLEPLPGAPRYDGSMDSVLERALSDAALLVDAGFPALMVENFGDDPFFAGSVPPETVAALTRAVDAVISATGVPVGVNVLRNDALSAVSIAAACGAAMVRSNILTGMMYTDQGPIVGQAAEVLRKRRELDCDAEIWADIMVKHATPPPGTEISQSAIDTIERGGADALIVSGAGTGSAPDISRLEEVRNAIGPERRLVVGSGAAPSSLSDMVRFADTFIIGSATKKNGRATNPVDPDRTRQVVESAKSAGLI